MSNGLELKKIADVATSEKEAEEAKKPEKVLSWMKALVDNGGLRGYAQSGRYHKSYKTQKVDIGENSRVECWHLAKAVDKLPVYKNVRFYYNNAWHVGKEYHSCNISAQWSNPNSEN